GHGRTRKYTDVEKGKKVSRKLVKSGPDMKKSPLHPIYFHGSKAMGRQGRNSTTGWLNSLLRNVFTGSWEHLKVTPFEASWHDCFFRTPLSSFRLTFEGAFGLFFS
ncbi:hypothetical protein K9755_19265, partial [Clostridioides difficile]|nr:hypothetical protein [Clostridioides difficile]